MKSVFVSLNRRLVMLLVKTLACLLPMCSPVAKALPNQGITFPFQVRIVPIATDLWLDRYRLEISLAEFESSIEDIAAHFDRGVHPQAFGSARLPAIVRWFEGGVLISWWQASKLVSLHLRPVSADRRSAASSGILMIRHGDLDETSGSTNRSGPCSQSIRSLPEQAMMLRTVGSRDGDLVACFGLAKIDQPLPLVAQRITEHLKRIGYKSTGLPRVVGEQYQIHSFQNEQAQLSVAIHARADETLLIFQTVSSPRARRFAPFSRR